MELICNGAHGDNSTLTVQWLTKNVFHVQKSMENMPGTNGLAT